MEQGKNNTSKIVVILTVILALIFIPTGFVLGKLVAENEALKSNISSNDNKDSADKDKVDNSKDSEGNTNNEGNNNSDNSTKVCSGFIDAVYEGGYKSGDLGEYLTLTLSKDGNVIESYRNSEAPTGTYTLKDNKLTISLCPTYGPCDEKIVTTYDITSDCSTIKWGEVDSYQYDINRK